MLLVKRKLRLPCLALVPHLHCTQAQQGTHVRAALHRRTVLQAFWFVHNFRKPSTLFAHCIALPSTHHTTSSILVLTIAPCSLRTPPHFHCTAKCPPHSYRTPPHCVKHSRFPLIAVYFLQDCKSCGPLPHLEASTPPCTCPHSTALHQTFYLFLDFFAVCFLQEIPDYESLQKLEYLDMFIKECLRMNLSGDV